MSATTITDAVARHFVENVAAIKAAYAVGATAPAKPLPSNIADAPVVIVYWQRFNIAHGSYERIRHFLAADLYVAASDAPSGYRAYMDLVTPVIVSFRSNVSLFGEADICTVESSDVADAVSVNSQPFMRLTFNVEVLESGPAHYTLTPS